MNGARAPDPERVLVLAPTASDAALSRSILTEADLACCISTDLSELARDVSEGAGAVLLTAELLAAETPDNMMRTLFSNIAPHFKLDAYFNLSATDAADGFRVESCYGIPEDTVHEIARIEFDRSADGAADSPRQAIVNSCIQQS